MTEQHTKCDWRVASDWEELYEGGGFFIGRGGRCLSGKVNNVVVCIIQNIKRDPKNFTEVLKGIFSKKPFPISKETYGVYVRKEDGSDYPSYYTIFENVADNSLKMLYKELEDKIVSDKALEKELTINKVCGNTTHI